MSNPTKMEKLEREIKSKFDKVSEELNLMMAIKMEQKLIKTFKDSLTDLRKIKEEIGKLENSVRLEIEKIKVIARKDLKEFKTEKAEDLENELRFLTVKNRSFRKLRDYEEEKEARKIIKKNMKDIEEFKTEAKRIQK